MSIIRPRDTTIVLTATNKPVITLLEEHTPSSGKFEPTISWEPSQTINTANYFDSIQDSLVLTVKAIARNIADMVDVDSVHIILKKNVLDHILVTATPDSIEPTQASVIKVIAKDNNNNDLTLPGDTPVQFTLDAEGATLGKLQSSSSSGSSVTATWDEVQSGNVKYVAFDVQTPLSKVSRGTDGDI
ncbi:MAG: hypothetical protein ACRDGA_01970 [Bacteroidota bacterium]